MADIQVPVLFVDGDVVDADNFNSNYSEIVSYINDRNSASSTWDGMSATHGTTVPLTSNNSTGTQSIFQAKDNGTTAFEVFDGGYVSTPLQVFGAAYKSANLAITSTAAVKVTFDVQVETQSVFDSNGKFTTPEGGKYQIDAQLYVRNSGGRDVSVGSILIYKNGAEYSRRKTGPAVVDNGDYSITMSDVLSLAGADTIEIYLLPSTIVNFPSLFGGSTRTFLRIAKLS